MNNRRIVICVAVLSVFAVLIYILYNNVTWNFTLLSFLLCLAILFLSNIYGSDDKYTNLIKKDKIQRFWGSIAIVLTTFGICWSLHNYFFATGNVYTNSDHHAVRINGVTIHSPQHYLLAGEGKDAFLDNEHFKGSLRILQVTPEEIVLDSKGFTQVVYINRIGNENFHIGSKAINLENLIRIQKDDHIQFISNKKDTCELFWEYYQKKDGNMECYYLFKQKAQVDTMRYHSVLKKGLDLNTLYGEVQSDLLAGVHLLREDFLTNSKKSKYYINDPFVLELNREVFSNGKLKTIRVIGADQQVKLYHVNQLDRKQSQVRIPIGKPFQIGLLGGRTSRAMYFAKEDGQLKLNFFTPQYHYLSPVNKLGANNVFITSTQTSIIHDKNAPENIMLFDLFHSDDNTNHFAKPINLSYVSGPTTQELEFRVNWDKEPVKAQEKFGNVQSKNKKLTWNIQVENFKDTAKNLVENRIMIFFIVLSLFLIYIFHYGRIFTLGISLQTFVELIAYLILLVLLAFRFVLMWRAAVFPPVEHASIYELIHFFRSSIMFYWLLGGLNVFLATVMGVKILMHTLSTPGDRIKEGIRMICLFLLLTTIERYLFHLGWDNLLFDLAPILTLVAVQLVYWFFLSNTVESFILNLFGKIYKSQKVENVKKLDKVRNWLNRFWPLLCYILVIAFLTVGLKILPITIIKILAPVLLYFTTEAIIWRYLPPHCTIYNNKSTGRDTLSLKDVFFSGLGFSLVNGLLFSILFFLVDGGYGIMFFSFYLFFSIMKLYDFVHSNFDYLSGSRKNLYHILLILALVVGCGFFFYCYTDLLCAIGIQPMEVSILVVTIVLFVFCLIIRYVFSFNRLNVGWSLIISVLLSVCIVYALRELILVDHTKQRVLVHALSPEEGLENTHDAQEQRCYFEATMNDYILNIYNQRGAAVSVTGKEGNQYFKLSPHSEIGAMFGAQVSDILMARFIIAEHGMWLSVLFLLIFLLMVYFGMKMKTVFRVSKMLLMQIPGLLFFHLLFVWMANTQLFVFLGQDIPLLSLQSKLAVFYYFILIAIWVGVAVFEKTYIYCCYPKRDGVVNYYHNSHVLTASRAFMGVLCALLLFSYQKYIGSSEKRNYQNGKFTLENSINQIDVRLQKVQTLFDAFQDSVAKIPMNICKINNIYDVSRPIYAFNQRYENDIKTIMGGEDSYIYRTWENFAVKGGAKHNSLNSLIYVRRKNHRLEFRVYDRFFNKELPSVVDNKWRGSIVEHRNDGVSVNRKSQNEHFTQYILPAGWVNQSATAVVLKKRTKRATVIGNDSERHGDFIMDDGYTSACCRFSSDRFESEGLEVVNTPSYFARNVIINGNRDFVYPEGKKFFWASTFAKEIAYQKNQMLGYSLKYASETDGVHHDVPITIDKKLTADIYDYLEKKLPENLHKIYTKRDVYFSVIVADGDGQVRAMVDRKPGYNLDPNARRRMAELTDSLAMDFDSNVNNYYFGNLNLMNLRYGPASSQKPIVWTAIASGIDYDWKNLMLNKFYNNAPSKLSNYYVVKKFNGEVIYLEKNEANFSALSSDENGGKGVTLTDYMHHSSNFYNAMMLYIGSHEDVDMSMSTLDKPNGSAMFEELPYKGFFNAKGEPYKDRYDESFPILTYANAPGGKLFKFHQTFSEDYQNSILFRRLSLMFDFNSEEAFSSLYPGLSSREGRNLHAYASNPYFHYPSVLDRENISHRLLLIDGIHQAAVGGAGVWKVSPYAMAQSFARLTMLRKDYRLSLQPLADFKSDPMLFEDLSNGYWQARSSLLKGMNKVFSSTGTIRSFAEEVDKQGRCHKSGYYIYGKTGTAHSGKKLLHDNQHRLGIIITDRPIENLSKEELKKVKFYTVYFSSFQNKYGLEFSTIVDKIIASDSFKQYMNK